MSDLGALLSAELADALEQLVDERVAAALEARGRSDTGSPWLTIQEAAERLRISERQLHRWLKRGRVRSTCIGRRRLLHRDHLDEMARSYVPVPKPPREGRA